MPLIAKELVFKVLALATAGGTVAGGGVVLSSYLNDSEIKELKKIGLGCKENYCTSFSFGKDGFSIKQDEQTRTVTSLNTSKGKIRVQIGEGEGLSKYTFYIEDGDISLIGKEDSDTSHVTKLEEFETYVFEEQTVEEGQAKKYHFKRKTKATDEIKKLLGLTDSGCELPEGEGSSPSTSTCTMSKTKLKAINFEGKDKAKDPIISDTDTGDITLTITGEPDTVAGESEPKRYPYNYRFSFSGEKQMTIPGSSSSKTITKNAGATIDFRIKKDGKNLTLEKVWDVERLAWRLGLTDCNKNTGKCKFPANAIINVYKGAENSVKAAKVTDSANQTISFEEGLGTTGYEGGVKFTVDKAISFTGGTHNGEAFNSIAADDYEIKEQTVGNEKDWYLTLKTE